MPTVSEPGTADVQRVTTGCVSTVALTGALRRVPPAENLEMCGQARNKVISSTAVDFALRETRQKYDSNFKPAQV